MNVSNLFYKPCTDMIGVVDLFLDFTSYWVVFTREPRGLQENIRLLPFMYCEIFISKMATKYTERA